ncbi:IclR family transcriptional regulator [Phytohabitans suffuscus]|uniref:IclR family transcriptional regulator n=1 Tax=Phytohabitans suffuscus TaxID=624315 RepID=A0A6F8YVZ2_9ACTN|nr:IclR family transcriptional regulator [Phytohabitans suffuscus]BCB90108.1 IclR family transcriptional regulator [Phytohabitans suffuscus]
MTAPGDADKLDPRSVVGKIEIILDAFTMDDVELSLADLVRRTGLPRTTVHRICQVATTWGVLERSGGDYRLGLRLFELGQRVPRQRILRDAARPYMQELLYRTRSVIHLAIIDGLDALVIERLSPFRQPTRLTQIAGRMPMHCTAVGKALLAYSHPNLLTEVLRAGLPRRTPRTITSALHLGRALERARETGTATEVEEMHVGYLAVGAPVLNSEKGAIAAISVTSALHTNTVEQLTDLVKEAAAGIGATLRAAYG